MRGVILDVDGTLVDSNDAHAHSWVDAFREHGHDVSYDSVRPLIGMGGDRVLCALASIDADSRIGEEIVTTRKEIFLSDYLGGVRPFPRVRELLERMRHEGLKLAVASSSEDELLEKLLRLTGAANLLQKRPSARQARSTKPAPDLVQAALDVLKLSPGEAVMLGDTPYDRDAANGAGVAFVGFRSGGWSDGDLADAIAVYHDTADLLEHFDSSAFSSAA